MREAGKGMIVFFWLKNYNLICPAEIRALSGWHRYCVRPTGVMAQELGAAGQSELAVEQRFA